ncbi:protein of unknown function [Hyphomicrobium sp. MC1]|nr:protein of unknown function [Hyphomicrobium sp. MC1]
MLEAAVSAATATKTFRNADIELLLDILFVVLATSSWRPLLQTCTHCHLDPLGSDFEIARQVLVLT